MGVIVPDKRWVNSKRFKYIKEHNNYDLTIGKTYPGYLYNSEWVYIAEDDNYRFALYRKECFEIVM